MVLILEGDSEHVTHLRMKMLSIPKFRAKPHCTCLSIPQIYTEAVQIGGQHAILDGGLKAFNLIVLAREGAGDLYFFSNII